ncbi:MAG TPA: F0F1 ATP synthase subunit delta [Gemmatimonadaceae bacterium]|nr:F0F1 ATP synthase subunit delta [Gemmatimonadaceae bacterium]
MREPTIARNYAEALLALARKANDLPGWGRMISDVANAVEGDERLRRFLEAPQVSAERKNEILGRAFQDRVPRLFLRFLQKLVDNRRQMLIPAIATQYHQLVDAVEGRVHAQVTVARPVDEAGRAAIAAQLGRALGKTVVPHVAVNPAILGGVVVRVGDTVMDGSVRRRLSMLRGRLVGGAVR